MELEKLTYDQLKEIINSDLFSDNDSGPEDFFHDNIYDSFEDIEDDKVGFKTEWEKLGKIELIDEHNGEWKFAAMSNGFNGTINDALGLY